jgi:hypothetical protein
VPGDERQLRLLSYAAARNGRWLRTGDSGLCRASSLEGRLISQITRSEYTHATMIGWAASDALMMAETREHFDARLISLSGEVRRWPGYYDIYRPAASRRFNPGRAWSFMCHAAGSRYGWNHIVRVWARRRISRLVPPIGNSDDPQWPRDCSALVHAALRAGGGPSLKTWDCDVVPGDLADSRYLHYVCTLFWSDEEIALLGRQSTVARNAGGKLSFHTVSLSQETVR